MKTSVAALAVSFIISACGGGGATAPTTKPIIKEGLYLGSSFNFWDLAGQPTSVIVLEQQEVWMLDGVNPPKFFGQGTFAYAGKGSMSNGSSANVFVQSKALAATNSNVLGERSMELRFDEASSRPFVLIPESTTGTINQLSASFTPSTSFDYNKPASISDVSGEWGAVAPNISSYVGIAPLVVSASGDVTTPPLDSGCRVTGTLKPRLSGKNVFNLSVTLTGCADAGEYAGIAFNYIDTTNFSSVAPLGVPTFRLIAANSSKTKLFNLTTTR